MSPWPAAVVWNLLSRLIVFPEAYMRLSNASFSFQSSAIFSLFSLFVLRSQWSCGWKMENCKKCSPGIRCGGCSDGNHVSHHEKSVRLKETEISTVCGKFVKVEVTECHRLHQWENDTASNRNFPSTYWGGLMQEKREQASYMTVLLAQETRHGKLNISLPSGCAGLAISGSSDDHCRWCFCDLTPKQSDLGQGRGKEACSSAGSKLRAISSLFSTLRSFLHSWYTSSVCFYACLEKLAYFQLELHSSGTGIGLEVVFQWDLGGGNDNHSTEGVLNHCEAYNLLSSCFIKKYPLDIASLK